MVEFEGTAIPKPSSDADVTELHALSKACSLQDVRFINIRSKSGYLAVPETTFGRHSLKIRAQLDASSLMVSVRFMFLLSNDQDKCEDDNLLWQCTLQVLLTYEVAPGTYQSSHALGAFAFVNAVQSAWPYLRQALHDTAFKHGIPGIVLQTRHLQPPSAAAEPGNELSAKTPPGARDVETAPTPKRKKQAR